MWWSTKVSHPTPHYGQPTPLLWKHMSHQWQARSGDRCYGNTVPQCTAIVSDRYSKLGNSNSFFAFTYSYTVCSKMCNICSFRFIEATSFNGVQVLDFLIEHGVLKATIDCPKCGAGIEMNRESLEYRCQKRVSVRKQKKSPCAVKLSARTGSFFDHTKKDLVTYFRIVAFLLHLKPPRQELIMTELDISSRTCVDWYSYCREVFIDDAIRNSGKIGGKGKCVEIDEAKFGRSKYNRGRHVKGQWVFGGVERGSSNSFYVPVEKRDADTLIAVLREWVLPETTIVSDCWKAYKDLNEEGFKHYTVNHSVHFVDPDTGAHTNTVERSWREVRCTIPRFGVRKHHFAGYLAEYHFKRRYGRMERLHHFFCAAGRLYPPTH